MEENDEEKDGSACKVTEKCETNTKPSFEEAKTEECNSTEKTISDLPYSLYICPHTGESGNCELKKLCKVDFERLIESQEPVGQWLVSETSCGLLIYFSNEIDRTRLMRCELHKEINCPIQVAKFTNYDMKSGYSAIIKNLPFSIPLQDITKALENQGIKPLSVERFRQTVKVEINDFKQYENLVRNGLDFFGASRFPVTGGKWQSLLFSNRQQHESVLQCYRCQGFWHLAANCEQTPCCVRCGDAHSVDVCTQPRNRPRCCHCGGPHHAAYKHCPVRQELINSTPVSLTLSTTLNK
ncbi:hypothetical protein LSTR_LSTR007942 [Laodelphax striatellus]|uniref:CCHC-type domain-containing protein n=1 Tax=Laodelphax striatellus TaxID=195883 RepID=A0A482XF58_LAOST|nr:hypothetical protein LSTR_LSTR007942 [Laodelphax striatellus]